MILRCARLASYKELNYTFQCVFFRMVLKQDWAQETVDQNWKPAIRLSSLFTHERSMIQGFHDVCSVGSVFGAVGGRLTSSVPMYCFPLTFLNLMSDIFMENWPLIPNHSFASSSGCRKKQTGSQDAMVFPCLYSCLGPTDLCVNTISRDKSLMNMEYQLSW